jgi:hypothetical protein
MKKILFIFLSLIFITTSNAENVEKKLNKNLNKIISNGVDNLTKSLKSNDKIKYLDIEAQIFEDLKPTFGITNVNSLAENQNTVIFNQNSLSLHNDDQTINIGFGYRSLINDDKIILGSNIFFDQSFKNSHKRSGIGVEAISSIFDLRSNYYNALSRIKTVGSSTEEALDGFDARLDFHLPKLPVHIYSSLYEFENSAKNFELKGHKYGVEINDKLYTLEIGYDEDNHSNQGMYANLKFVLPLNSDNYKNSTKQSALKYTSVADKLYQPVKRENKIRVLKIDSLGMTASTF